MSFRKFQQKERITHIPLPIIHIHTPHTYTRKHTHNIHAQTHTDAHRHTRACDSPLALSPGPIGAVDTETAAILVEHEISNTEFTPRSMNHLPATEDVRSLLVVGDLYRHALTSFNLLYAHQLTPVLHF